MLQHAVMLLVYKFLYLNLQLIMEVDLKSVSRDVWACLEVLSFL